MNWTPTWIDQQSYLSLADLDGEEWKQVTHWKGRKTAGYYMISNLGRLKSCRIPDQPRLLPGTLDMTTGGYVSTLIYDENKKQMSFPYHQAVAYYFIGPPPADLDVPVVDHIDSDKLNNRVSNLQWLSMSDNTKKALREGRCEIFSTNGGWNRESCYFEEYPEHVFDCIGHASEFIGHKDWYVKECIKCRRPIRDRIHNQIVHVVFLQEPDVNG